MEIDHSPQIPKEISDQIAELPSNKHYILITPSKSLLKSNYAKLITKEMNPYLMILPNECGNLTDKDIAERYIRQNNLKLASYYLHFKQFRTDLNFWKMTLDDMRRQFNEDSIDGFSFELYISQEFEEEEAGFSDLIQFDNIITKKSNELTFYIPKNNFTFYVAVGTRSSKQTYKIFLKKIVNSLTKQLNIYVKEQKLGLFSAINNKQVKIDDKNYNKLTRKQLIIVNLPQNVNLSKIKYEKTNQTIIIEFPGKDAKKFLYQEVNRLKIFTILDQYFQFNKKGLSSTQFGLRILDKTIKANEAMCELPYLEKYMRDGKNKSVKIMYAIIVKESTLFYNQMEQMDQELYKKKLREEFQKILSNNHNNGKRQLYKQTVRKRANSTQNIRFKNKMDKIEPIFYYSTDIIVNQSKSNATQLYNAENIFLRNQNFAMTEKNDYLKWQNLFAKSLYTNLRELPIKKGEFYRGIKYSPNYKVGDKVPFKQYNSTSQNINVALGFATKSLLIFKNCQSGRNISEFCLFNEEEVLHPPYTEYLVESVQLKSNKHGKTLDIYELKEIDSPDLNKNFKEGRILYVLWVGKADDQGHLYSKNVQNVSQCTIFEHFLQTAEVQQWLKINKETYSKDPTISILLITNMFRVQKGKNIELAGVQAIKIYRNYVNEGKVLVYIGNMQSAKQKLITNNLQINSNLKLTDSPAVVLNVLFQHGVITSPTE